MRIEVRYAAGHEPEVFEGDIVVWCVDSLGDLHVRCQEVNARVTGEAIVARGSYLSVRTIELPSSLHLNRWGRAHEEFAKEKTR